VKVRLKSTAGLMLRRGMGRGERGEGEAREERSPQAGPARRPPSQPYARAERSGGRPVDDAVKEVSEDVRGIVGQRYAEPPLNRLAGLPGPLAKRNLPRRLP